MPVLLLARGDQESKTMLRRAIETRYGLGPPAIETLKIEVKGQTRATLGPLAMWMPLEGIAYFKFPHSVRWNYTTRPAGVALGGGEEAFDGNACRKRSSSKVTVVNDARQIASAKARLAAVKAVLLMPLAEHEIELRATGERSLDAIHGASGVTVHLQLNEDYTLEFTSAACTNPSNGKVQTYFVRLSDGQAEAGDLMLPRKLGFFWDNQPEMELSPVAAESNPTVDAGMFTLEQ